MCLISPSPSYSFLLTPICTVSSDEEIEQEEVGMKSQSLALRFQKKFLGMTIKSKDAVKSFVDDNTGSGDLFKCICSLRFSFFLFFALKNKIFAQGGG